MKKENIVVTRMFREALEVPAVLIKIYSEEVVSGKNGGKYMTIEDKCAEFENEIFEIVFDRIMFDLEGYGYSRNSEVTIRENYVYYWVFGDRFKKYDLGFEDIVKTEKYINNIVHETFKKLGGRDVEELEEEILEIRMKRRLSK